MANQVTVVAILMIVQGVLECLMGLFLVVMAFVMPAIFDMADQQQRAAGGPAMAPGMPLEFREFAAYLYGGMGAGGLLAGIPHVIAGIRNLSYRGRGFGLFSLFFGCLSFLTCYCAPTSLGLMIYGLIVYFNPDTARAFELGEQGKNREEIREALAGERQAHQEFQHRDREPDRGFDRPGPPAGPDTHVR